MTSIQSNVNLITVTTLLKAASFYCMLGNVDKCTMHKLHGRMCIMNSWCTRSELKAPSDYSKRKRASKVLTKASLLKTMYCLSVMENAGIKAILVSGYQAM